MGASKYLIALWTAAAVYAVLSLLTGAMGFSAYRELLSERDKQRANMEKLGLINETLENTKNSLLYDRDTIAVYARELGYGGRDERFVRIVGLGGVKRAAVRPGEVVRARRPEFTDDRTIKIIALSAGGAVLALLLVLDAFRRARR
ncbi:MAG: septum formation initiator family protein [Treponema sp.]|jgi:cell division protein FtsB|nr:septum formation initiator family protein [Treponema sp.]